MTRRRELRGVLHNFLSSLTSRYSDYEGYWLMGFVARDGRDVRLNLLGESARVGTQIEMALATRAISLFRDQVHKVRLPFRHIERASLIVSASPLDFSVRVNGQLCPARKVTFTAEVTTDLGTRYERSMCHLIAPHDPEVEMRCVLLPN